MRKCLGELEKQEKEIEIQEIEWPAYCTKRNKSIFS